MVQTSSKPPTKRKRGQPSLLTPVTAKMICDLVRSGNYLTVAAQAAGVDRATLTGWLKEGGQIRRRLGANAATATLSDHRRALVDFSTEVEKALAQAEARDVMNIGKAAQGSDKRPGDWRASAFLLERRNKERWSQRTETEVTGALATVDAGRATQSAREWVMAKLKRLQEVAEQQQRERAAKSSDA